MDDERDALEADGKSLICCFAPASEHTNGAMDFQLQAIYQEDFEVLADGTWRIGIEHGCKVKVKVDSRYPDHWICTGLCFSLF